MVQVVGPCFTSAFRILSGSGPLSGSAPMPVQREAGHRAGDPCEAGFCLQTSPLGQRYSYQGQATATCPQDSEVDMCLQVTPPPLVSGWKLQGKDMIAPAPPHLTLSALLHLEALISLPGIGQDGLSGHGPRHGYPLLVTSSDRSPGSDRLRISSVFFLRGGWQVLKDAREPLETLQFMFASLVPMRSREAAGRHLGGRASRFGVGLVFADLAHTLKAPTEVESLGLRS